MMNASAIAPPMKSTILIADDEASARSNLADILKRRGFGVTRARSGSEAIRKAENSNIAYILMDIRMRGELDGIEAARIIAEKHPDKQIIFVTGHSGVKDYHARVRADGLDRLRWVSKPVVVEDLLDAIDESSSARVREVFKSTVEGGVREGDVAAFLRGISNLFSAGELNRVADVLERSDSSHSEDWMSDINMRKFREERGRLENLYPNEYVAIYDGNLVGHGPVREDLVNEVYGNLGRADALIMRLGEPTSVVRFRHPFRVSLPQREE